MHDPYTGGPTGTCTGMWPKSAILVEWQETHLRDYWTHLSCRRNNMKFNCIVAFIDRFNLIFKLKKICQT